MAPVQRSVDDYFLDIVLRFELNGWKKEKVKLVACTTTILQCEICCNTTINTKNQDIVCHSEWIQYIAIYLDLPSGSDIL